MSGLFDRYYLVLSGRVDGVACGVVASPLTPSGGVTLGWPLAFPDETQPTGAGSSDSTPRLERSES